MSAAGDKLAAYSGPSSARERTPYYRNLLYGEHKAGKTIAASFCGKRPALFSADNGWVSLKDWSELDHVIVDECQSLKHFEVYVKALIDDEPMYREIDHVIVDPFNLIVNLYIDYLQDNYSPSSADARVYWTKIAGAPDLDSKPFTTAGMGDYQAVRNYFRKIIYPLFRIPKHVTLICHEREPSFMDKHRDIRAALPGQTLSMVAQSVDFISHMIEDEGKRTISFKPSAREDAGSRFRHLHGKVIRAEDLPKIYTKWDGT
jgi:hypothetical protein